MTSLALSRIGFNNSASTYVVLAAANKLKPKPMIAMPDDHHGHGHDHHMALPNAFQPSTANSLKKLLLNGNGNLKVTNAFTSIHFLITY
jgi:hypothetical protein